MAAINYVGAAAPRQVTPTRSDKAPAGCMAQDFEGHPTTDYLSFGHQADYSKRVVRHQFLAELALRLGGAVAYVQVPLS